MKKLLILFISAALSAALISTFLNSPHSRGRGGFFTVQKGYSLSRTATELERKKFIKNARFFSSLRFLQPGTVIKAGRYEIPHGLSSLEIYRLISYGTAALEKLTIPEGWNIYQIANELGKTGISSGPDFLEAAADPVFLRQTGIISPTAEGYLFPDTYFFARGTDPRRIIRGLFEGMKDALRECGITYRAGDPETEKILILASLIEKEARIKSEQPYISSVFHNRLKKNMRLDCDPTVRYAVKRFEKPIRRSDLKYDSPYNTYLYKGLTPTPICSPGKGAIEAAISPLKTSYLFFVARNDGSHYFSKTLGEHNRAVNFYQRNHANGFIDRQILR